MTETVLNECGEYVHRVTEAIYAKVIDEKEKACMGAIYEWAKEKGIDEVLLIDEVKLKEIIRLGSAEYSRLYGD